VMVRSKRGEHVRLMPPKGGLSFGCTLNELQAMVYYFGKRQDATLVWVHPVLWILIIAGLCKYGRELGVWHRRLLSVRISKAPEHFEVRGRKILIFR
jgi:hypothetical protein